MYDYDKEINFWGPYELAPWTSKKDIISSIIIEPEVTSIGEYAFSYCGSLTSVTIGDSVTSIGEAAFCSCSALTSVTIPGGVTSIGNYAFEKCSALTSVAVIGNDATSIGIGSFCRCTSLTSVTIGNGVTSILDSAFSGCSSLTSVTIGDGVTNIYGDAFSDCSALTSVTISDSVTSMAGSAFDRCESLAEIIVSPNNMAYSSIDGSLFFKDLSTLVWVSEKTTGQYIIPDSVTSIGASAFSYCSSLTSVTIPDSVTSIEGWAFEKCSALTSVTIPDSVTSIGYYAFEKCSALTDAKLSAGAKKIENGCFSGCTSLNQISIPEGVTTIGSYVFRDCKSLTSIEFPISLDLIGYKSFEGCENLADVTIPGDTSYKDESSYGVGCFYGCNGLETMTLIGDSMGGGGISWNSTYKSVWYGGQINRLIISQGIKKISMVSDVSSIVIPKSVERIGDRAFTYCNELTDIFYEKSEQDWNDIISRGTYTSWPVVPYSTKMHYNCFVQGDDITPLTLSVVDNNENPIVGVSVYQHGMGPFLSDGEGIITIDKSELQLDQLVLKNFKYTDFALVFEKEGYRTKKYKVYDFPKNEPDSAGASIDLDMGGLDGDLSAVGAGLSNRIKMYPKVTSYNGDFSYLSLDESYDSHAQCLYSDDYFAESNAVYNHSLAKMSLALAMSAFNSSKNRGLLVEDDPKAYGYYYNEAFTDLKYRKIEDTPACNVADLMYNCGFDDISVNEDFIVTTEYNPGINDGHNIGCCIGNKTLSDGTVLIAIALRGAGYGCEWIGNFEVYSSLVEHRGFGMASTTVINHLEEYIEEYSLSGKKVKLWITGYSRSGAVANLAAAYFCDNGISSCVCDSSDIYAYTFEAPRGTKSLNSSSASYNGIWNIINPIDPVPMVAMKIWGYRRYGHTVHLTSFETRILTYNKYSEDALRVYNRQTGKGAFYLPRLPLQLIFYEAVIDVIAGVTKANGGDQSPVTLGVQTAIQTEIKTGAVSSLFDGLKTTLETVFSIDALKPVLEKKKVVKETKTGPHMGDDWFGVHYPDTTFAWMSVLPASEIKEFELLSFILCNCPVDIAVYDQSGVLQLRIINDEVIPEEAATIEAFIDEDGQKILIVPSDIQARIEILATGEGEFNYSVQEVHLDDTDSKIINYESVSIEEGDTLTGTVSAEDGNGYVEYHLYEDAGEVPIETAISGAGADEMHMISVEADGEGTVSAGDLKKIGEFIQVEAIPAENVKFEGWFEEDNLLSTETTYRHKVTGETTLTAKFKSKILFSDVTNPDDFFYDPIYWAVDNGITTGYSDNTFRPNNLCHRAAVVTFLWRMAGKPDEGISTAFSDMTGNDDFDRAITWASNHGITTGYSDGTFRPYNPCHRAAIVTFLWRYANKPEPSSAAGFSDMTKNVEFDKAIAWAAENNITTGYNDGTFRPYNSCLRLAVVTFLYRYAHL